MAAANYCSFCRPPECNGGPARDTGACKTALKHTWKVNTCGRNCLETFAKGTRHVLRTMHTRLHTWRAHGRGCHFMHEARLNCASKSCVRMWSRCIEAPKRKTHDSDSRIGNTRLKQGGRTRSNSFKFPWKQAGETRNRYLNSLWVDHECKYNNFASSSGL